MNEPPRQPAGVPAALRGFGEFALERFPFAAAAVLAALESVTSAGQRVRIAVDGFDGVTGSATLHASFIG